MEKGNAKSSSSKSNSCDSKNKQDVPNKYFRLPRAKDNISPRPETRKKSNNPQRNRELFDKRPRNKTGTVCERYRREMTEGAVGDSTTKQGCKKTNLNYLLNFSLAPPDNWDGNGRRRIQNRTKLPKYNKELFLQANCQFVARDNGNYSVHQKNPDILVEWSLIEEIRLPCHEVPSCPICLFVPVAAKITRCGHIYCWPCILHYLALTDKSWQKCPICFEAVHKTELKSASLMIRDPLLLVMI
ncbi:RING finger protein 10 [Caerostris darwini]|uniref:E3 ubiquitin-protein ligase RNF10 n=1 Tax=Caerostris darwini TaxID=1538125 RepID=A0AAV4WN12_9ARAC|nr:RING finger protein 10 [Caerostris darwini]